MKKHFTRAWLIVLLFAAGLSQAAQAQDPVTEVIKAGVKKAIVAMDLKIQRLQNETIWLQNAQKVIENELSELRLTEIADWTERQRQLYAGYYQELWKVKAAIASYGQVRDIIRQQAALVEAYRRAYALFRQDSNLSPAELDYMQQVYTGILGESVKDLDQVLLVISSFTTQMSDGERLALLHRAAARIGRHYSDLREFNEQGIRLSLQRAREHIDLQRVKRLYGLQ
ncbi:conjugal transfer protein TraI [Pontibacter silvestris]|uniref:Conjugal transfer protein TraI n=1 Tax=Pontibacter silvestris TaxID=2305183 RepID=A0ABW4X130_9BACT|nr:conjugal transfer protein TraI [Pontibacter silvestris]MCC9137517.1 conjugal transfer protein TraI [Pontibacter silvestris]